jgi:hypothetical protein
MISAFGKFAFVIMVVTAAFFACKKDTVTNTVTNTVKDPVYFLRGNATAKQEVPTNPSTATGTLTGRYNKDSNTLSYTVTWTGLTGGNATAGHFHGPADPGVAAGVVVPFTGLASAAAGTFTGSTTLTDAQETDLLNGLWYFNIHNATYPGGEIRGQVVLTQ